MGVTAIKRAGGKEVYQIAFSFMGVQCRETITRQHSKASMTYCVNLRSDKPTAGRGIAYKFTKFSRIFCGVAA